MIKQLRGGFDRTQKGGDRHLEMARLRRQSAPLVFGSGLQFVNQHASISVARTLSLSRTRGIVKAIRRNTQQGDMGWSLGALTRSAAATVILMRSTDPDDRRSVVHSRRHAKRACMEPFEKSAISSPSKDGSGHRGVGALLHNFTRRQTQRESAGRMPSADALAPGGRLHVVPLSHGWVPLPSAGCWPALRPRGAEQLCLRGKTSGG